MLAYIYNKEWLYHQADVQLSKTVVGKKKLEPAFLYYQKSSRVQLFTGLFNVDVKFNHEYIKNHPADTLCIFHVEEQIKGIFKND